VYRIYHRENAGRPVRLRWALEEAGAPYDYVVMTREVSGEAEHRARHPFGKVPVLESEDGCLFESAAVCLQVADLHPEANLIPAPGTYERGLVYQWTVFSLSELEPTVVQMYRAREDGNDEAFAQGDARLTMLYGALEQHLGDHEFLVEDRFTIADVVVGSTLNIARRLELRLTPVLQSYLERLDERPARQRAYSDPFLQPTLPAPR
jgi:glutathione S-transferase